MIKLDILIHPTISQPEVIKNEPAKTTKKKWKFPWRINMLATPKPPVAIKYEPPPPEGFKVYGPLDPATEFRSDHLARPFIRMLMENKALYRIGDKQYLEKMDRIINKSWASIYNYYKKILRDRQLKSIKRRQAKLKERKPKGKDLETMMNQRKDHLQTLSTPRKLFLPEEIPRERKQLEDLQQTLEILAQPKVRPIPPAREVGVVSRAALIYEITEAIANLAQPTERMKQQVPDINEMFAVKRSALTAICTPRIEKLAQPSFSMREAKKQDEDKYDPWAISPTALKYKATPRILELAKPQERE